MFILLLFWAARGGGDSENMTALEKIAGMKAGVPVAAGVSLDGYACIQ